EDLAAQPRAAREGRRGRARVPFGCRAQPHRARPGARDRVPARRAEVRHPAHAHPRAPDRGGAGRARARVRRDLRAHPPQLPGGARRDPRLRARRRRRGRAALGGRARRAGGAPAELPPGFVLGAILEREDPRDAFVSSRYSDLKSMPARSIVGTSSLRRAAQIAERYPQLEMRLLRGNVETRIAKLDRGEYDGIILAVAGLVRLGLASRIRSRLDVEDSLPAPGQGALGAECLSKRDEVLALLAPPNAAMAPRWVPAG